jgi:hypothetical protein
MVTYQIEWKRRAGGNAPGIDYTVDMAKSFFLISLDLVLF